jgi:putative sterol carrier protein/putative NADPH-quinone reductase
MKILALNGSPRKTVSATFRILESLLAGMRDAGAKTELLQLRDLDLKQCIGCYTCWVRTPGACIHADGMAGAADAMKEANVIVFGTPLYHYSMSGLMKTFLDRLLPDVQPWLIEDPRRPELTTHPRRGDVRPQRAMLVSPCGFPEPDHFRPLVETFRYIAERHGWQWMGELLRPGAEPLSRTQLAPLFAGYLATVRKVGAALIEQGRIPDDLSQALARDLFPGGRQAFYDLANRYWKDLQERHPARAGAAAPLSEADLDPADGPGLSCRMLIAGMAATFEPRAADGLDARIEFRIGGAEPGVYHLAIGQGACRFAEGPAQAASLTIDAPSDVWAAIATGARDGRMALMEGAYRASGDFALLLRMGQLFARSGP